MKQYLLHNDALEASKEELKKQMDDSMSYPHPLSPPNITGEPVKLPPTSQPDIVMSNNSAAVIDPVFTDENSTRIQITGRNIRVKVPQNNQHTPVAPTRVIHNFGDSYAMYR